MIGDIVSGKIVEYIDRDVCIILFIYAPKLPHDLENERDNELVKTFVFICVCFLFYLYISALCV